jgi:hypothetical protein
METLFVQVFGCSCFTAMAAGVGYEESQHIHQAGPGLAETAKNLQERVSEGRDGFEFEFVYSYTLAGVKKSKATNDTVTAFRGR